MVVDWTCRLIRGVGEMSTVLDTEIVVWDIVNETGLFRLKGHKDAVTCIHFLPDRNMLLSTSKDTFVKFWDLSTQHCFKTLTDHHTSIWNCVLSKAESVIITGTAERELRIWKIADTESTSQNETKEVNGESALTQASDPADGEEKELLLCTKAGVVVREAKDRVVSLHLDESNTLLACSSNETFVEVFKFRTHPKKKKKKKENTSSENAEQQDFPYGASKLFVIKAVSKIASFDFHLDGPNSAEFVVLLNNNSLEVYNIPLQRNSEPITPKWSITFVGHRTDIRSLCFSSDNAALLSASAETVKIWNSSTQSCIRTLSCEFALCSLFVPGDRHCIIGTKTGKLQLFDISGGELIEDVKAHQGAVWSICPMPNQRGFISGSADKEVKFWEFDLVRVDNSAKPKALTVNQTRILKLEDDVLSVTLSNDDRLLAVALLDNTVKIFFVDTLKFFISLYGHKFPVLCMDISYDSTLIVTGSADRNIKIWGLDFGDCHKSIFAHDDSIMCIQFLPKTHMFFSGGKDSFVKWWDADNFERISSFKMHHDSVWAVAVSPDGRLVASASRDRSIRILEKTNEILLLEEEREMEREQEFENSLLQGEQPMPSAEANMEVGLPSKKTIETIKAGEKLIEAVEVYNEEMEKLRIYKLECADMNMQLPLPTPHALMVAHNIAFPEQYVLHVLKQIKSSELEEAVLLLPFNHVVDLLQIITLLLKKKCNIEILSRSLFFLLRVHHNQITSNQSMLSELNELQSSAVDYIEDLRDMAGFNMAGLQFLQHEIESQNSIQIFSENVQKVNAKKAKRKKKELIVKHAMLSL